MASHDPADRIEIASIGAHASWAKTPNRSARTAPARAALMAKFEAQVDPDGLMSPQDRAKAVENAKSAYFRTLARKSRKARAVIAEVEAELGEAS